MSPFENMAEKDGGVPKHLKNNEIVANYQSMHNRAKILYVGVIRGNCMSDMTSASNDVVYLTYEKWRRFRGRRSCNATILLSVNRVSDTENGTTNVEQASENRRQSHMPSSGRRIADLVHFTA